MRTKFLSRLSTACALIAGTAVVGVVASPASPASAARSQKVTICHRTNATTNPYRLITVSQSSITRNNGHTRHDNRTANNQYGVFDPNTTYPSNAKNWSDIIPGGDADGLLFNGSNSIAQNWDAAGKAFMLANGTNKAKCRKMSAKEFYDSEIAAGENPNDVLDDLEEQQSNEDKKLKEQCGGSWTGCDPTTWDNKVKVETTDPTNITKTTAKLNGVVTCGADTSGAPVKYYFEWGTDAALAGATSTTATAVASNGQTVSVEISGLTTTTYYYKVVCVTDYELDTEGVIEGSIKNFSITTNTPDTTAPAASSDSSTTTVAGSTSATTVAAAKGKVTGKVWLEIKKDAKHATTEPLLSGLTATLKSGATVVGTKTTGANGDFEFTDLAPGTYIVTVTEPSNGGIVRSSDSDGSGDWIVTVTVTAGGTATAEYAAVGSAKTGGKAVRTAGGVTKVIPNAKVTCTWAGPDGKLGTDDDADFSTTAAADGTYLLKGIPTGEYDCIATDPKTGEETSTDGVKVTAASAKKSDAAVKTALLKITGTATTLPATGNGSGMVAWFAVFALLCGLSLMAVRRRFVA